MINGIVTNCGLITPQVFETCNFGGQPSLTHNHIPYMNRMLCQWAYNVPMRFSWVMVINAHNKKHLINKIKSVVPGYEPPGWNMSNTVDDTWTYSTQDVVGCIFAQGVDIPGENVNVDYAGISEGSNRGFINAPIINGRSNFDLLGAGFLETNRSFVDGVLRPWTILAAHEGLLATTREQSIKSDITIYQLAKMGECSPNIIRKAYVFHDCVPINIQPDQLDYNSSSDYPKMQAKFVYNSYYIDDMSESQGGRVSTASKSTQPSSPIQGNIAMSQSFINSQNKLAKGLA
jgi:hypothetical protein